MYSYGKVSYMYSNKYFKFPFIYLILHSFLSPTNITKVKLKYILIFFHKISEREVIVLEKKVIRIFMYFYGRQ